MTIRSSRGDWGNDVAYARPQANWDLKKISDLNEKEDERVTVQKERSEARGMT